MNATDPHKDQRARLPTDYIGGTCEGRRAPPSNPNRTRGERVKEGLSETVIFRCTVAEKAALVAKADAAGLPNATLMREALGLVQARRRKPVPRVDPARQLVEVAPDTGNGQRQRRVNTRHGLAPPRLDQPQGLTHQRGIGQSSGVRLGDKCGLLRSGASKDHSLGKAFFDALPARPVGV